MPDAPFVGVHIVGAVAQVVDKAQSGTLEGYHNVSTRYFGRQDYALSAQIAEGLFKRKLDYGEGIAGQFCGESECVLGDIFLSSLCCQRDTHLQGGYARGYAIDVLEQGLANGHDVLGVRIEYFELLSMG